MNPDPARTRRALVRNVLMLQLKLLLDAVRDLALAPLALGAAALDLALSKQQAPRYFHKLLRLGERSDAWIDLWSGGRDAEAPPRENVDALLVHVEQVLRDPGSGARRARVLRRWAERQVRARRHAERAGAKANAVNVQPASSSTAGGSH